MQQSQKNNFDDRAKTWDSQPERVRMASTIANAISSELPEDPSLTAMEYGCGTGLISFPLKDRFSKITLIDSSEGMLNVVKEKIDRERICNMDVLKADLLESNLNPETSFSVIYCSMVLHHMSDIQRILQIWYSLLKTPGYLCIADLDSENGLFHGTDFKGHNGFDRNELNRLISAAGFVDVKFKTVYELKKIARDGVERTFPLFLAIAKKNCRL